jgi:hypothetical protein
MSALTGMTHGARRRAARVRAWTDRDPKSLTRQQRREAERAQREYMTYIIRQSRQGSRTRVEIREASESCRAYRRALVMYGI